MTLFKHNNVNRPCSVGAHTLKLVILRYNHIEELGIGLTSGGSEHQFFESELILLWD
jgi:hypothetical protein